MLEEVDKKNSLLFLYVQSVSYSGLERRLLKCASEKIAFAETRGVFQNERKMTATMAYFATMTPDGRMDKFPELERNVCTRLQQDGVHALAPTQHMKREENDHLRNTTYILKQDTMATPLVVSGVRQMGVLGIYEVTPGANTSHDKVCALLSSATASEGNKLRAKSNVGGEYTLDKCFDGENPGKDKCKWSEWLGKNDYLGAFVEENGLSHRYYVVVKSDAGVAGQQLAERLAKETASNKNQKYGDMVLDKRLAAVNNASLRNNARIAHRVARVSKFGIMSAKDVGAKVDMKYEQNPQMGVPSVNQRFNTFHVVNSTRGLANRFVGYFDGTVHVAPTTKHVVVPVSPRDGIVVYQLNDAVPVDTLATGVPLGTGTLSPDDAARERDKLKGLARNNVSAAATLETKFSWPGRAPGNNDNAELWRYAPFDDTIKARFGSMLNSNSYITLKPIHVNLPAPQ